MANRKGWRKLKQRANGLHRPDIPAKGIGLIVGLGLVLMGLAKMLPGLGWKDVGHAWLFLLMAIPFVALTIIGIAIVLAYQRGQERKVRDGLTTIHRRQIEQIGAQALGAHWTVEQLKAGHAPVPQTFSGTWNVGPQQAEVVPPAGLELPVISVPTVMELLRAKELGAGKPIYLGVNPEQEIVRQRWKEDIGSFFALGSSGAGKTTFALATSVQIVMEAMRYTENGKCLLIADPHYGDEESLGTMFEGLNEFLLAPIAESEQEILALSELMVEILEERLANPRGKDEPPYFPIFGMWDEWLKIYSQMACGKKVDHNLSRIATEGRKKAMNVGFFTQMGTKDTSGDVRAQATSTFLFRVRADQARYAYGERPPMSPRGFRDGECYAHTRRLATMVQMPYIGAAEVAEVGEDFGKKVMEARIGRLPKRGILLPEGLPGLPEEEAEEESGSGGRGGRKYQGRVREDWEAKREYVLEALRQGVSVADVRRTVLNVTSSGRDGQDARKWIEWLAAEEAQ